MFHSSRNEHSIQFLSCPWFRKPPAFRAAIDLQQRSGSQALSISTEVPRMWYSIGNHAQKLETRG